MLMELLVVFLVFVVSLVECKYCWHTSSYGKRSHFYCGAFEYCCKEKCCENFDEFYKLWYFWLCVLIMLTSCAIALYWLRRRYLTNQCSSANHNPEHGSRRRRRHRRYRHLSNGTSTSENTAPVVPTCVVMSPPPYSGDNTGVPHPGPPPYSYCLGSGSSINSHTVPRFPPAYSEIVKEAPPLYSSLVELSLPETDIKKSCEEGGS